MFTLNRRVATFMTSADYGVQSPGGV